MDWVQQAAQDALQRATAIVEGYGGPNWRYDFMLGLLTVAVVAALVVSFFAIAKARQH